MKRDDDQELWDLLGRGAEPKISPFFARNVLREIRQPNKWANLREWLTIRRLVPAASLVMALVAVAFLRMQTPLTNPATETLSVNAQDYEVIADLEDLLASEDNNSLDDSILL